MNSSTVSTPIYIFTAQLHSTQRVLIDDINYSLQCINTINNVQLQLAGMLQLCQLLYDIILSNKQNTHENDEQYTDDTLYIHSLSITNSIHIICNTIIPYMNNPRIDMNISRICYIVILYIAVHESVLIEQIPNSTIDILINILASGMTIDTNNISNTTQTNGIPSKRAKSMNTVTAAQFIDIIHSDIGITDNANIIQHSTLYVLQYLSASNIFKLLIVSPPNNTLLLQLLHRYTEHIMSTNTIESNVLQLFSILERCTTNELCAINIIQSNGTALLMKITYHLLRYIQNHHQLQHNDGDTVQSLIGILLRLHINTSNHNKQYSILLLHQHDTGFDVLAELVKLCLYHLTITFNELSVLQPTTALNPTISSSYNITSSCLIILINCMEYNNEFTSTIGDINLCIDKLSIDVLDDTYNKCDIPFRQFVVLLFNKLYIMTHTHSIELTHEHELICRTLLSYIATILSILLIDNSIGIICLITLNKLQFTLYSVCDVLNEFIDMQTQDQQFTNVCRTITIIH